MGTLRMELVSDLLPGPRMPASEDKIPPLDGVPDVGVEPAFPKMSPKGPPLLGEAEAGVGV